MLSLTEQGGSSVLPLSGPAEQHPRGPLSNAGSRRLRFRAWWDPLSSAVQGTFRLRRPRVGPEDWPFQGSHLVLTWEPPGRTARARTLLCLRGWGLRVMWGQRCGLGPQGVGT